MDALQRLDWSPEQVSRFWDYQSANACQESYFAHQVGEAVVRLARYATDLRGLRVLDFGSGPGHLVPWLLQAGATVFVADSSPNSVAEVSKRFTSHSGWGGSYLLSDTKLPVDDDSFDFVFCLETIEHLSRVNCQEVLAELHRVVRPGGHALYTTPNEEKLEDHFVYCPQCNCEFHRMQHMRSWSADQLNDELCSQGYNVHFCRGLDLWDFQRERRRSRRLSRMVRRLRGNARKTLDWLWPRPFPHQRVLGEQTQGRDTPNLVAIASKPQPSSSTLAKAA